MSITSDLRTYADKAAGRAQAQLNDVTGQANELYGKTKDNVSEIANKATGAVHDLRTSAEKAVNLEAIKTAIEPYLAQARDYASPLTDRAESLFDGIKGDKRVAKLVDTVEDRVVKPVQSLIGFGSTPATKRPAAATSTPATKPAATKPVTPRPVAAKPAARKAPAKRASRS